MRKMSEEKWKEARVLYEDFGVLPQAIADKFDVTRPLIDRRISEDGWVKPAPGQIKSAAKAAAVLKLSGEQVRIADINKDRMIEAETRLARQAHDIMLLHRSDWDAHREVFGNCAFSDMDQAKLAKASAEVIMLRQKGERETWEINGRQKADSYEDQLKALLEKAESAEVRTLTMSFGSDIIDANDVER